METTTKKLSIVEPKAASKNTFYNIKILNNKIIYLKKKMLLNEAKMIKAGKTQDIIDLLMGSYAKELSHYLDKRDELKINQEIQRVNDLF